MDLAPGSIVSVRTDPFVRHYGILTDEGTVVSASKKHKEVVEQPLEDFAYGSRGKSFRVDGYPSELPAKEVIEYARSKLGEPYHLTQSNCEHLVHAAHGKVSRSKQLEKYRDVLGRLAFVAILSAVEGGPSVLDSFGGVDSDED